MLKRHAKKWFTLIEMLIVIVIIGILAAYLIPRISWAQGKARDVARKADLRQYSASLSSYMLDKRTYPTTTGGCVNDALKELADNGYITSIDKDPGSANGRTCDGGYYYYSWSNTHYFIISAVDEDTSANRCTTGTTGNPILWKPVSAWDGYTEGGCADTQNAWFVQTD